MAIETEYLNQKGIRWTGATQDGYGGQTFDDPVEIDVRWEDRRELFVDATGKEVLSRAVVYVGVDLDDGDYLMLGELTDLDSGSVEPRELTTAYEVRAFSKIPDLAGTRFVRKAFL